jgi:hypothetical protein
MTLTPLQARHCLLRRQGLGLLPSKADAMRAMVAVQTQYAQSLGQALAARSSGQEVGFESIVPGGPLVKSWTLRNTVHTHTREDYRLVLSVVGPVKHERYRSTLLRYSDLTTEEIDRMEANALEALKEGPLSRRELHARVPDLARTPWPGWGSDMRGMALRGLVSFVDKGFALLDDFEPVPNATEELARRYLSCYGPATFSDFACWVGLPKSIVRKGFETAAKDARQVFISGYDEPRFVIGELDFELPRAASLLAKFDPLSLSHFDRSLLFAEKHRPRVFRIAGQIEAVFLLGGEAWGTWRAKTAGDTIVVTLDPWRTLRKREVAALEKEADRLAGSLGLRGSAIRSTVQ